MFLKCFISNGFFAVSIFLQRSCEFIAVEVDSKSFHSSRNAPVGYGRSRHIAGNTDDFNDTLFRQGNSNEGL